MRTSRILTTVVLAFAFAVVSAQVLQEPSIWRSPKYDWNEYLYFDGSQYRADYEAFDGKRYGVSRQGAWMVSATREGVPVYASPGGAATGEKLSFSQELWVLQEKGEYLQVVDKRTRKDAMGWVHKRDLILWATPLVDRYTNIEIKAFVVNTTRSGTQMKVSKEKYKVYDGPTGDVVRKESYIYDVLFVYRYERGKDGGAGRYLVSPHYELNSFHKLDGWISEERVKIWNTSLCIEPNWDRDAIRERQQTGIEAKVFAVEPGSQAKMQEYLRTGKGQGLVGGVYRDPAFVPDEVERNPRMTGKLFRYPVFGGTMKGTDNCEILTGVSAKINLGNTNYIAGIDQDSYVEISRRHDLIKEQLGQVNIVFVVEATAGMQGYLSLAAEQMRALAKRQKEENRFSFGAVVYRNDFSSKPKGQEPEENYFQATGLSDDAVKTAVWLERQVARDAGDPENTQAMHYALKRAIGMMGDNQANILIHIARSPDHSADDFPNRERKTFVSINDLGRTVSDEDKEVHYIGYTAHTNPDPALREDAFNRMHSTVMSTFAINLTNKFKGALGYIAEGLKPIAPRPTETNVAGVRTMGMEPSYFYMRSHLITNVDQMQTMHRSIPVNIDSCLAMNERFQGYMYRMVEDESATADMTGEFTQSAFLLTKLIPSFADSIQRDAYIKYFISEKVQVFADAQTLYRAGSLRQPLFRYVLFMPEERLSQRYNELNNLVSAINKESPADVRKKVQQAWEESAKDVLGGKDYGQLSIEELEERMLGIEKMEIVRPFSTGQLLGDVRIKDVHDPKKFSEMQFEQYLEKLKRSLEELKKIRESDNFYQVVGGTGTKFFWVPVEFYFG